MTSTVFQRIVTQAFINTATTHTHTQTHTDREADSMV